MTLKRFVIIVASLAVLSLLITTGAKVRSRRIADDQPSIGGQLNVITTTFPLYDFTRTIAADVPNVTVVPLLPPGVGTHDFSPTPESAVLFARADIVIRNGLGLDAFTDKLIAASGKSGLVVVDTSLGIPTLVAENKNERNAAGETASGADPHIWLNPRHAIRQVQHIRDALISADPTHRTAYEQNANRYVTALESLDASIEQMVAAAPRKEFVTFHSAFRYFAQRYNLNQLAVFQLNAGVEPTPLELTATMEAIKKQKVTTVFVEPQFSPKLVETIASDLALNISTLDPIETGSNTDSYLTIMNRNLESLRRGLN